MGGHSLAIPAAAVQYGESEHVGGMGGMGAAAQLYHHPSLSSPSLPASSSTPIYPFGHAYGGPGVMTRHSRMQARAQHD